MDDIDGARTASVDANVTLAPHDAEGGATVVEAQALDLHARGFDAGGDLGTELDGANAETAFEDIAPAGAIAHNAIAHVLDGSTTTPPVNTAPFVPGEWFYSAIEALVFASPDPLSPEKAKDIISAELMLLNEGDEGVRVPPAVKDVKKAFSQLIERWNDPLRSIGMGFRLVEVDGGICFRTAAANARYIRRMQRGKPQKLSRAALETLSVVAYRQPVTKPQIEEVRGVDSGGALKALLDKRLVRVLGKADDVGRPLLYGTTKVFLDFFGLASLHELPTLKELHELDGTAPTAPVLDESGPSALVMDLFHPDSSHMVSRETEQESDDALVALERALGEAKKVAKNASSLVFGIESDEEADADDRPRSKSDD
jgi:segregation and condensation protein B